jgi:hypothetical protein
MKQCYLLLIVFSTVLIIILGFVGLGDNLLFETKIQINGNIADYSTINTTKTISNINYLTLYPNLRECRLNYSRESAINTDYTQVVNETAHEYRINRAIIFYYPIENSANFEPEFKWLFQSWLEMQTFEPDRWRTDLIFFINSNGDKKIIDFFETYNCRFTNKRFYRLDKPMCRLVNYIPIKDRLLDKGLNKFDYVGSSVDSLSNDLYHYLYQKVNIFSENFDELSEFYVNIKEKLSHYSYVDSILIAFDGYKEINETYDLIMRSDMVGSK